MVRCSRVQYGTYSSSAWAIIALWFQLSILKVSGWLCQFIFHKNSWFLQWPMVGRHFWRHARHQAQRSISTAPKTTILLLFGKLPRSAPGQTHLSSQSKTDVPWQIVKPRGILNSCPRRMRCCLGVGKPDIGATSVQWLKRLMDESWRIVELV